MSGKKIDTLQYFGIIYNEIGNRNVAKIFF